MDAGMDGSHRLNLSAGLASVAVALFLVAIKLWALATTGALSVAASLADSALDLIASGAGLAAILYAARPPDSDHSFGHSSAEDLVALGQSLLVVVSAGGIGWTALRRLAEPTALSAERAGAAVMAVSIAVTAALVLWQGGWRGGPGRRSSRPTGCTICRTSRRRSGRWRRSSRRGSGCSGSIRWSRSPPARSW
jgi:ferrous-iron efflux pump FieF